MAAKRKTAKRGAKIRESAHQIWLAGLGAFSTAGDRGSKLFKSLVQKGQDMEQSNKARLEQVLTRADRLQGDARSAARTALVKVTRPFENGMDTAMHKLGVPTRKEIQLLTKRVEELTRVVQKRSRAPKTSRRSRAASAEVTE